MNKTIKKNNISSDETEQLPVYPLKLWQDISAHQEVRIEMLPMIDVIFCILIFFILAAVGFSRQQALNLDLPKASTGEGQMREMLVVSLDDYGQLFLEKQPVSQVQLYSAIKTYHDVNPKGLMVLHASKNITYEKVIDILDMLKEVGGNRVALATLSRESQAPIDKVNSDSGFNPFYSNPQYNTPLPNIPSNLSQPPSPPSNLPKLPSPPKLP